MLTAVSTLAIWVYKEFTFKIYVKSLELGAFNAKLDCRWL